MVATEGRRAPLRRRWAILLLPGQVRYQLRVLVRSPLASFATLAIPLMVLVAVNLLYLSTRLPTRGDIRYVQFFTPAMVAFAVVNTCFMSVISSVTLARDAGILKRIRSTPLPAWAYLTGRIVTAALVSVVSAVVVLGVGAGVYGVQIIWAGIPRVALDVAVAIFCFSSLGFAATTLVTRTDSALPLGWGTILPLCFISDVFQPIDGAPAWLRGIASFFPLRPFADDLESALNPVTGSHAVNTGHLAVMAAWGLAGLVFAVARFRWDPIGRVRGERGATGTDSFAPARLLLGPGADRQPVTRAAAPAENQTASLGSAPAVNGIEPGVTEVIEGPAPAEDSSVPC